MTHFRTIKTISFAATIAIGAVAHAAPPSGKMKIIPIAFRGEWRPSLSECRSDGDGQVQNISSHAIGGYESVGFVTEVVVSNQRVIYVKTSWEDQQSDEKWLNDQIFTLSRNGLLLTQADAKGTPVTQWYRCPVVRKR
jgi:hypothetical protein